MLISINNISLEQKIAQWVENEIGDVEWNAETMDAER